MALAPHPRISSPRQQHKGTRMDEVVNDFLPLLASIMTSAYQKERRLVNKVYSKSLNIITFKIVAIANEGFWWRSGQVNYPRICERKIMDKDSTRFPEKKSLVRLILNGISPGGKDIPSWNIKIPYVMIARS